MNRMRSVSEDRIKCLDARVDVKFLAAAEALEADGELAVAQRILIEGIGRSIAEKLFEFEKVLVVRDCDGRRVEVRAEIEIIVPDGPP